MKDDVLKEKSFTFAVRIVKLSQWLGLEQKEFVLSKQILRSGTAIGALISEALFAQSKADFVSKLSIALKEANETRYWIKLLNACEMLNIELYKSLLSDITELIAILISSINTAKKNIK